MKLRPQHQPVSLIWGSILSLCLTNSVQISSAQDTGKIPTLRVGLKASWNSAPFLLELLETAALDNPLSFYPLLNEISTSNVFSETTTDQAIYDKFLQIAKQNGYLTQPEDLSSFDLALSIRSVAPRIEAHYQYFRDSFTVENDVETEENLMKCPVVLEHLGSCIWTEEEVEKRLAKLKDLSSHDEILPFDQIHPNATNSLPTIALYADVTNKAFSSIFKSLNTALKGKYNYKLRHKPSSNSPQDGRPVMLSGYGVELVLKKTDYIVMDDRNVGQEEKPISGSNTTDHKAEIEDDLEAADIKPLRPKDLQQLGVKAASYVMGSKNPLATLNKILQDFPKYSASLAAIDVDEDFALESMKNRRTMVLSTDNQLWINGNPIDETEVNVFALAEQLRLERKSVNNLKSLGLSTSEAVKLLSHPRITEATSKSEPQRFDWRELESEKRSIIWLNNLEKDKRYAEWPSSVSTFSRGIYPGQIHTIRRNVHHLVLPMDLSDTLDIIMLTEQFQTFIQRMVALRFGIVPMADTAEAKIQAKMFYYLVDSYGLGAAMQYFQELATLDAKAMPKDDLVQKVIKGKKLRKNKTIMTVAEILESENLNEQIERNQVYGKRLGIQDSASSIFINGLAMPKSEQWLNAMSQSLMADVQGLQKAALESKLSEDFDFAKFLLGSSYAQSRNTLIFPEDDAAGLSIINLVDIMSNDKDVFDTLPTVTGKIDEEISTQAVIWVIGDFDQASGYDLLYNAAKVKASKLDLSLVMINNPERIPETPGLSTLLLQLQKNGLFEKEDILSQLLQEAPPKKGYVDLPHIKEHIQTNQAQAKIEGWAYPDHIMSGKFWDSCANILDKVKFKAGERGLVINGRVVGPIPSDIPFGESEFEQLINFELAKRITPVLEAAKDLGASELLTRPFTAAKLTSLMAYTAAETATNSLFNRAPLPRSQHFNTWEGKHSSIVVGDNTTATLQIVAVIDPASETAQKWVPILTVLSEMEGVSLKIFLNPERAISELPVKRFYRHVLHAKPQFDMDGALIKPEAVFKNIPEQALLTLGMEVPPSWLVAPVVSLHDLDNIKLKAFKDRFGTGDITALYGLTNILIEGHSRDISSGGQPPRGAQIILGTKRHPLWADTIIMANLGYFQFKANPGHWTIALKEGRSQEIFTLDSPGSKGYQPQAGDESKDITLMSFKGATLFPRFSRKPGMEARDVLEQRPQDDAASGMVNRGKRFADNLLSKVGLGRAGKQNDTVIHSTMADINIFSVASGHLYERFLNIMMLSVMRHTNKKVKFWFIENFLSPSFKDFIPVMAEEYGFEFELVTYKWPHWLRGQKEKQREIWGYKILFLDVLFPLDLDKVIFVDADQIVRTDLKELVDLDLEGAPYGFTPMCDSRTEIEGFRFWKQGYWKSFLRGKPYHISALYVVDLVRFRQIAAGDRLRQQYHQLSADPGSLANLDQDLPNHMQGQLPIFSLPQDWLWCETWCSDESLRTAKTIDLCNNPMTKEPKLDRARRQVPEWNEYDGEVAKLAEREKKKGGEGVGYMREALVQKEALGEQEKGGDDGVKVEGKDDDKVENIEKVVKQVVQEKVESVSTKDEL